MWFRMRSSTIIDPSDLCCRCCRVIPKEEMPKYAKVSSTPARSKGTRWLGDTGTDQDIVGESQQVVARSNIREADVNITLSTANGPITADKSIDTHIPALCGGFSPYVLKDSPPALSIGKGVWKMGTTLSGVGTTSQYSSDLAR